MIVGIDGNEANVKEKVGVSVYTLKQLEHFQKSANKNLQFIVFLKYKPSDDLPNENQFYKYQHVPGNFLWSQTFLPIELYRRRVFGQKIDLFFSPAHYAPRFCPIPFVVTIHDLSYFYYPAEFLKKDLHQLKSWTKYSVEKAKKVIAVSNTTKKDVIKFYGIDDKKIEVIYNGYEKNLKAQNSNVKATTQKLKLEKNKYILFVGTLQPRKNIDTLIEAFGYFKKQNPSFKLIIVGKKGWLYDHIFKLIEDFKLKRDVIYRGYVTDDELGNLYKNAFSFVLPSFYEGFGIPVLEAMGYGCPVISSFASSLPEVGGDASLYFDPKSPSELAEKLTNLKDNKELRKQLIEKGKVRIKQFSWQKCAEQTLQILKNASFRNMPTT
ncbi:glycosyltransferase family 4 protein [Candidatus Roizmanbacteria bacterium]|nr:glycosyltransferase family 4 protein [Candidatus Roizmanbacteria bacterium]